MLNKSIKFLNDSGIEKYGRKKGTQNKEKVKRDEEKNWLERKNRLGGRKKQKFDSFLAQTDDLIAYAVVRETKLLDE